MSLLEIPREPTKKTIRFDLTQETLDSFEAFIEFAKTEQAHASKNNVLEFVLQEFFGSARKEVTAFNDWCAGTEKTADTDDESVEGAVETSDESAPDKLPSKPETSVTENLSQKPAPNIRDRIRRQRAETDELANVKNKPHRELSNPSSST